MVRYCTKCGTWFPLTSDYFGIRRYKNKFSFIMDCKSCKNDYIKRYQMENKDSISKTKKIWVDNNKESLAKKKHINYRQHVEDYRIGFYHRNAIKADLPHTFTIEQWDIAKQYFNNRCCYCERESVLHQEHFIAESNGGGYTKENIIPACHSCNSSKCNKSFFEWYPKKYFYSKEREEKILKFLSYENNVEKIFS